MRIAKYVFLLLIILVSGFTDTALSKSKQEIITLSTETFAISIDSDINELNLISEALRNESIVVIHKLINTNKNNLSDLTIKCKIPPIYDEIKLITNNWNLVNSHNCSDNYTYMSCKVGSLNGRENGEDNYSELFGYSARIKKDFDQGPYPLPSIIDIEQNDRSGKVKLDMQNPFNTINTYELDIKNNKPIIKYFNITPNYKYSNKLFIGDEVIINFSVHDDDDNEEDLTCYLYDILLSQNNYTSDPVDISPGVSNYTLNMPGEHIFKLEVNDKYDNTSDNNTSDNVTHFLVEKLDYNSYIKAEYKSKAMKVFLLYTLITLVYIIYSLFGLPLLTILFLTAFFIPSFGDFGDIHAYQIIIFIVMGLISMILFNKNNHESKMWFLIWIISYMCIFWLYFYKLPELYDITLPFSKLGIENISASLLSIIPIIVGTTAFGFIKEEGMKPSGFRYIILLFTLAYFIFNLLYPSGQPLESIFEFELLEIVRILWSQVFLSLSLTYFILAASKNCLAPKNESK